MEDLDNIDLLTFKNRLQNADTKILFLYISDLPNEFC